MRERFSNGSEGDLAMAITAGRMVKLTASAKHFAELYTELKGIVEANIAKLPPELAITLIPVLAKGASDSSIDAKMCIAREEERWKGETQEGEEPRASQKAKRKEKERFVAGKEGYLNVDDPEEVVAEGRRYEQEELAKLTHLIAKKKFF